MCANQKNKKNKNIFAKKNLKINKKFKKNKKTL